MGARVLQVEDFQNRIACPGAYVPRMEDPALLPVGNPPDGGSELTPDNQAVEDLSLVFRGVPLPAGGDILCAGAHRIFCHNTELPHLPSI